MSKAWYALRRTIVPWRFDELLEELLEVLPQIFVDELIVKIDSEEFSHGQPNIDWVKIYCDKLKTLKNKIQDIGIKFSLNPWITVGHLDRGRDGSVHIHGLETLVDQNGIKSKCCACPLSQAWRNHIKNVWSSYAQLEPTVMWLEDDLRTFNHYPVDVSCFCDLHMAEFSKRIGQSIFREELVAAITKPGLPHPWRKEYLDMQRDIMIDTVDFIVKTVHEISTDTIFGLMSSGPRNHCLEGRDWAKLANVMSPSHALISRPPLGSYSESSLRGLYYSADSIKLTRHVLPTGTIEQTEVENIPFTQYSKSVSFTFLQMAVSFALGCDGVTMNLFDHCGSMMSNQPEMLTMLSQEKGYLNALAEATQGEGINRGVQLLFSPQHSYNKKLKLGDSYALEAEDFCLAETLQSLGVATTYSQEKVRAAIGQSLRSFSKKEIMKYLSDGLFLDAAAAGVLTELDFGKYIGLEDISSPVCIDAIEPLSAEEYHNSEFGGSDGKILMTLTTPTLNSRPNYSSSKLLSEVKIISTIIDPERRKKYPCMVAFENSLGGRVIIHLLEWTSACGVAFNNTCRREQIQNAMRWLSRESFPAVVPDNIFPLLIRSDMRDYTVLTVFNLTLDEYPQVTVKISDQRTVKEIQVLSQEGKWECSDALIVKAPSKAYSFVYTKSVNYRRPLILKISFE